MTLAEPSPALAEQSSLIGYLMGVASAATVVDHLATDTARVSGRPADDFVYLLLGIAGVGAAIRNLVDPPIAQDGPAPIELRRWLR